MYTTFELHFGPGSGAIPYELARNVVSGDPRIGTYVVQVMPTDAVIGSLLADDLGFTGHAFSVLIGSRSFVGDVPAEFLATVFEWASRTLATVAGDALFLANDADGSIELCRRVSGLLSFADESPRELTDAFQAFRNHLLV